MIELNKIIYRYPGESGNVLNELSLVIPDSGITAIMGPNGSGKSTAVLCMNGILIPESGTVLVDGISTRENVHLPAVRKAVGVVFQNPNHQFTSLTVERELAFGLENCGTDYREMKMRVDECLRLFELEDYRTDLPASLSGGEKQRVALASVAILEPRYLILDEATSLLSPKACRNLLRLVRDNAAKRGTSVILVTQLPTEALMANRVFILGKGRCLREDSPAELFRKADDLRALGIRTLSRIQSEIA
jgi:energy-coupling factor transport system ATP-binding protein